MKNIFFGRIKKKGYFFSIDGIPYTKIATNDMKAVLLYLTLYYSNYSITRLDLVNLGF